MWASIRGVIVPDATAGDEMHLDVADAGLDDSRHGSGAPITGMVLKGIARPLGRGPRSASADGVGREAWAYPPVRRMA